MIHVLLFVAIVTTAIFDSAMDAIKDFRTHLGDAGDALGRKGHPYKSGWHLLKHMMRLGCGCTFIAALRAFGDNAIAATITTAGGLYVGGAVWDACYSYGEAWYEWDERLRLRTGLAWLDKRLGFHWSAKKSWLEF